MRVFLFILTWIVALTCWIIAIILSFRGEFQLSSGLIAGGWISYGIGYLLKESLDY